MRIGMILVGMITLSAKVYGQSTADADGLWRVSEVEGAPLKG